MKFLSDALSCFIKDYYISEFYKILDEFNIFDKLKQKDEKPKKESE
jgi:hypothetical protein